MIISKRHRFVFIHLHKTGGTSIEVALGPHLGSEDFALGSTKSGEALNRIYLKEGGGLSKHSSLSAILNHVDESLWREYFIFSVVRNPFRRALSFFTFAKRLLSAFETRHKLTVGFGENFDELRGAHVLRYPVVKALWKNVKRVASFEQFLSNPILVEGHGFLFKRQVDQLTDNRYGIVNWYRIEEATDWWPQVLDHLQLPHESLPWKNVSNPSADWREHYTAEAEEHVAKHFARDFAAFGYPRYIS